LVAAALHARAMVAAASRRDTVLAPRPAAFELLKRGAHDANAKARDRGFEPQKRDLASQRGVVELDFRMGHGKVRRAAGGVVGIIATKPEIAG
jgi:hypothetical protein